MTPTIHFCTVVGGQHVDLLSRLIRHYTYLGVNGRWFINVHLSDRDDPIRERVESIAKGHDIEVSSIVVGRWLQRLNPQIIQRIRSFYPNDWCVMADQDEFQVYPDDLTDIVAFCERRGFDHVSGYFIDRIGPSGALPKIESRGSLWQQFPLGGFFSKTILRDPCTKVVVAKGDVEVGWGQHVSYSRNGCPTSLLDVPVHHFKWDNEVLSRLRDRHEFYVRNHQIGAEDSKTFLEYLLARGRIEIDDPKLEIRHIGNPYGLENVLD